MSNLLNILDQGEQRLDNHRYVSHCDCSLCHARYQADKRELILSVYAIYSTLYCIRSFRQWTVVLGVLQSANPLAKLFKRHNVQSRRYYSKLDSYVDCQFVQLRRSI